MSRSHGSQHAEIAALASTSGPKAEALIQAGTHADTRTPFSVTGNAATPGAVRDERRRLFPLPCCSGQPGPRYLLAYFPFVVLAVVDTHRRMRAEDPTRARRLSPVLLGVQRLVLLKTGTYRTAAGGLTPNPPDPASADTLVFLRCDQPKREALLRAFPRCTVLEYE
jgi:hypothetical protein